MISILVFILNNKHNLTNIQAHSLSTTVAGVVLTQLGGEYHDDFCQRNPLLTLEHALTHELPEVFVETSILSE